MKYTKPFSYQIRLISLLFSLILLLGTVMTAFAQGPTFGIRPEDATKGYFQFTLAPGESIDDVLIASNPNEFPVALRILMVRGSTMAAGGITFTEDNSGAAQWVSFPDAGVVEVPQASAMALPFQVVVPADALPGEYVVGFLGMLDDSTESPVIEAATNDNQSTVNVIVISQSAISMIITVTGDTTCNAAITSLTSSSHKGIWKLGMGLQNTGTLHFDATGEVVARPASGGDPVASSPFTVGYVIPGDAIDFPLTLESYPSAGNYTVEVNLVTNCGYETIFSQPMTISDEEVQQAAKEVVANQPATSTDEAARILAQAELVRSIGFALAGLVVLILVIGIFLKWRKPSN